MASADDALCTIISCDVTLARPKLPFGEVTGGFMILETIVQPAVWDVDEEGRGRLFHLSNAPTHLPEKIETWEREHSAVGYVYRT